jgi:hypothetical protein
MCQLNHVTDICQLALTRIDVRAFRLLNQLVIHASHPGGIAGVGVSFFVYFSPRLLCRFDLVVQAANCLSAGNRRLIRSRADSGHLEA